MSEILHICLIACPLVFVAGFVDSVAGGGGIISIPAYLLAGMPTYLALGTNKLVACMGTALSSVKYFRSGRVIVKIAALAAAGSLAGSFIGTNLALLIPERALRIVVLVALPAVALFLIRRREFGQAENERKQMSSSKETVLALGSGLAIGLYDGLIGPGTGTFFILIFSGIFGLDLLTSSGCAKISNLASNVMSTIIYLINGKIWFAVAVPAIVCCMLGNYAGARYAIKGGSGNVRKIMLLVLVLLFVKIGLEMAGIL
ncbi:MAG: sulfite exporter TauE/SafE family protein [Lachnospiraceae bacterium]|jgi:uncharacterized membrane protein YfcA|nr:sulfite exporter TauE/SafE family protein [Lachnospiraceae bacterium]